MFLVKYAFAWMMPNGQMVVTPQPVSPATRRIYQEMKCEELPKVRKVIKRGREPVAIYNPRYFAKDSNGNAVPLSTIKEDFDFDDDDFDEDDWEFGEDAPKSQPMPIPPVRQRKIYQSHQ